MYYQGQAKQLGNAKRFAVKIQNRDGDHKDHGAETHWLAINTDQFRRIVNILTENDTTYEIQPGDVGQPYLRAFGKSWPVADFMGRILPADVGKHVHKVTTDAGDSSYLQVENDEQRDARLNR